MQRLPTALRSLSILTTLSLAGCLTHPATRQGDTLMKRGELREAYATYQEGLEQGVDSEQERDEIARNMNAIRSGLREDAQREAARKVAASDTKTALAMLDNGAWGSEALFTSSVDHLVKVATHKLEKPSSSELSDEDFAHIIAHPATHARLLPVANRTLRAQRDALPDASSPKKIRAEALQRLATHPAWRIQGLDDAHRAALIASGDALLSTLASPGSQDDLDALILLRRSRSLGHAAWDKRVIELLGRHISTQARALATQSESVEAYASHLLSLMRQVPMTRTQLDEISNAFQSFRKNRARELVAEASSRQAAGLDAQAYLLAALARRYDPTTFSTSDLDRASARFAGNPPEYLAVEITVVEETGGNCARSYYGDRSVIVGASEATRRESAVVKTYFECNQSANLQSGYRTLSSTNTYGTQETTMSSYEYCQQHSSSAARGRCTRYLDSRSSAENESTLTRSETVVTGSTGTAELVIWGTVQTTARWGVDVTYQGKTSRLGGGSLSGVSEQVQGTRSFTFDTSKSSRAPSSVALSNGASASVNGSGGARLTSGGRLPLGQFSTDGPETSPGRGIESIRRQVNESNQEQYRIAQKKTEEALSLATSTGDQEQKIKALLRYAMLIDPNPSNVAVDIARVDQGDLRGAFVITETEPFEVVREAILKQPFELDLAAAVDVASGTISFETVPVPEKAPPPETYEVDTRGIFPDIEEWISTGIEQDLDFGPTAYLDGSSLIALSTSLELTPVVDASAALALSPKLTLKNTSLESAFYVDLPGNLTRTRGLSLDLRHAFARRGGYNDPKLTAYIGLGYARLARTLKPDLRREFEEGDDNPRALERDALIARYRQGAGYRFLGPEVGVSAPLTLKTSLELGAKLNLLSWKDLFEDGGAGEYLPMSHLYLGATAYISHRLFLHARATAWQGQHDTATPLGALFKLGVRL